MRRNSGYLLARHAIVLAMCFVTLPVLADEPRGSDLLRRPARLDNTNVHSRSHSSIKIAFRGPASAASQSTVRVLCDDQQAAQGTVVRSDGLILTKASELSGRIECVLRDGRRLPAAIVGSSPEHDLAVLKIGADDLRAVTWSDQPAPEVGAWLATTGPSDTPRAIGVVSAPSRHIPQPRAVLGIQLEPTQKGPRIYFVIPDSAASRANLRTGDVVLKVNDRAVETPEDVSQAVQQHQPGERVAIVLLRGDTTSVINAVLGDREHLGNVTQAEIMDSLGGPLSKRRAGFPAVLQHDTVLRPRDCGGPIVDLDGRVAGINIARASRVASYAIPAEVIKSVLPEMISGELAVAMPTAVGQLSGGR